MRRINHWIGGQTVEGTSGRTGPVWNPATGEQQAEVDFASVEEVDRAVATAKEALTGWRSASLSRRSEVMFHLRELVDANRKEIASLLTSEHGKVLGDALGEVARGLENIEFACGIPNLMKGGYSEQASTGVDVYSIRQPLGVVAGITPFNFPAMVPMWMFANAIACGNTFILKPSEKDPSASLFIGELLKQAGLPDGVFNVVHGDKVAVDRILEHPDIAAVSFVGSTPIARYIYETGTRNGKRVQALGGAKNHMVVLADADIDMAADAAVSAGYGSAGERCMAISVVVAVGDVADPLVDAIKARLPKLKVGPGNEPDSEMGPLITREHRDKVAGYLDSAAEQGATVVVDGRGHEVPGDGFFLGRVPHRRRRRGHGLLPGRDLRAGAQRGAGGHVRGGAAPRQRQPLRERHGHLHPRRRRRPPVPVRLQRAAWSASTCPSPCRCRTTASGAGRRRCSATCTCTDPTASSSTHGPRSSPRAGRTPRPRRSTSASRRCAEAGTGREHMDLGVVLQTTPPSWRVVDLAKRAEQYGFSHVWTFDSHILWQEPYVIYSQILAETRQVLVGPMVTNPATRDWTVTASLFATLNEMYGNRTICGIGRGDSAVRVTNGKPTTLATLRDSMHVIRELANGRDVDYKGSTLRFPWAAKSRLDIWMAAYGPKALALCGEVADGFILQLADPDIVAWTVKAVREAAEGAGRDPAEVTICVAAPAYVGTDLDHQRDQTRWFGGMVGNHVADIVARYGASGDSGVPAALTDYIKGRQGYDYNEHGQAGNPHTAFVPDEIVDRFCLLGPVERHVERLEELKSLGVDQFAIYLQHDAKDETLAAYGERVMPAIAEHQAARS